MLRRVAMIGGLAVLLATAAFGAVVVRMPLDDLVGNADAVVRGVPLGSKSYVDEDTQRIMTRHSFRVDEYLKGKDLGIVDVVTLGGEMEDIGQIVPGEARLQEGQELVLCLKKGPQGYYVLGMAQGVFQVIRHPEGWTLKRTLGGLLFLGEKFSKPVTTTVDEEAPKRLAPSDEIQFEVFRELLRRQDRP